MRFGQVQYLTQHPTAHEGRRCCWSPGLRKVKPVLLPRLSPASCRSQSLGLCRWQGAGLSGWVGWGLPISGGQGSGKRLLPFNYMQQPLCSGAITAFVHHMMAWLPVSSPERAMQPSLLPPSVLRGGSKKRRSDRMACIASGRSYRAS